MEAALRSLWDSLLYYLRCCIFGKNYEKNLREVVPDYTTLEDNAKNKRVSTKPFIARWVAERLQLDENNEGTIKMRQMLASVTALIPVEAGMLTRGASFAA